MGDNKEKMNEFGGYSEKVMDHFDNPRNKGKMDNPDAEAKIGNPSCGDILKIMIKVENNKIKDIRFQTFGCVAAIASSSALTELAKGKTLEEAKKITNKDVAEYLGQLPKIKLHCSNLAADALRKTIKKYEKKEKGGE